MHQLLAERLTTTPLEPDGGMLQVPDRPGLGFELDEDAVARATERHARQGPYLSVER
jgi:L-alanine-DL-glutamate epimerase-like enolase superfamily enzyme